MHFCLACGSAQVAGGDTSMSSSERNGTTRIDLTRHKISDREPCKACHAVKGWMANTQNVNHSAARGSLHRLVRPLVRFADAYKRRQIRSSTLEASSRMRPAS